MRQVRLGGEYHPVPLLVLPNNNKKKSRSAINILKNVCCIGNFCFENRLHSRGFVVFLQFTTSFKMLDFNKLGLCSDVLIVNNEQKVNDLRLKDKNI
jgi:hypothetical protein